MIKSNLILFGGTGTVGSRICETAIIKNFNVIEIGRKQNNNLSEHIYANYESYNDIKSALQSVKLNKNTAIVFAHRARNNSKELDVKNFYKAMETEINPYIAVHHFINNTNTVAEGSINIVSITSRSSKKGSYDVSFDYHVVKAAQKAAAKSLVYANKSKIFSNIVSIGEVIDDHRDVHSEYHSNLFSNAEQALYGKKLPSLSQISSLVLMLCRADRYGMSGQVLAIDSGLSQLSNEFILRNQSKQ